jgi:hypothetical protein
MKSCHAQNDFVVKCKVPTAPTFIAPVPVLDFDVLLGRRPDLDLEPPDLVEALQPVVLRDGARVRLAQRRVPRQR